MSNFDVTVTIGSRPLVKAILGLIEPALATLPGVYPLAVAGATDSGLRIDDVVTDVIGVPGTGLALSITANGHLFGGVPAAVSKNVDIHVLTTLTQLGTVGLPFGQLTTLPLGTGDAASRAHDIPLSFTITVPLVLHLSTTTDHELVFAPGAPTVTTPATPDVAGVATFLASARSRVTALVQDVLGAGAVVSLLDASAGGPLAGLLADLTSAATQRVTDTLASLPAISLGRMTAPAAGVSCATELVPTAAATHLDITSAHQFFLQIGLMLGGDPAPPGVTFAPIPMGATSTALDVAIANRALLRLLCCMVESLPNLVLPDAHMTTDGDALPLCCNWNGAVVNLGPAAFTNVMFSLCINVAADGTKSIVLTGDFTESVAVPDHVPLSGTQLLSVNGHFEATIEVDLNHLGQLTALKSPPVTAMVGVAQGPALALLLSSFPIIGFWVEGAGLAVQVIVENQLNALIQTVFAPLKMLTSTAVIPPGLLDVFGDLTSQLVTLDDLEVGGVAWAPPGLRRLPNLHLGIVEKLPPGGVTETLTTATHTTPGKTRPRPTKTATRPKPDPAPKRDRKSSRKN